MKTRMIVAAAAAIALFAAAGAFADGAGGVTHGMQYLDVEGGWYTADVAANTVGGFGYGVNHDGVRVGGFGLAFYSDDPCVDFSGGVGGLINGQQLSLGPLTAAAVLWTGVGCLTSDVPGLAGDWVVGFAELDVEVGWAVMPWMQVSCYAGMQVMGNVTGGTPFQEFLFYTPTVGVRVAWGSF